MSSGKGSGKFIVKLADQTAFGPKLTVRVKKIESNKFLLQLVHPNKTVPVLNDKGEEIVDKRSGRRKLTGAIIFEQVVENNNPDEMKAFLEVQEIGNKMVNPPYHDPMANGGKGGYVGGEYHNFKTEYQEILFIPAARKGKAKLKTKKMASQGGGEETDELYDENEEASTVEYSEEDLNQEDVEPVVSEDESVEAEEVKPKVIVVEKKKSKSSAKKAKVEKKVKTKITKVKNKAKNNKKAKTKNKKTVKSLKNKNKKKR